MDFPSKVDFRSKVYQPLPRTASVVEWDHVDVHTTADQLLSQLSDALDTSDSRILAGLFRSSGCHWRDTLALTAHLRTFNGYNVVPTALHLLHRKRGIREIQLNDAMNAGLDENVKWLSIEFAFRTTSPPAMCKGLMLTVPESINNSLVWKIWSMATWMVDFEPCPENENLLREPTKPLQADRHISTDVLIIGGGNSGLILGARLKALGVDFVIVEKNEKAGDNWANRYDDMRFHIYKSMVHTPYLPYLDDAGELLHKNELSAQMSHFAQEFHLNGRVMYQSKPESTTYDEERKIWNSKISCIDGGKQVSAKFLVLAHGGGFSGRFVPDLPDFDLFEGSNQHSVDFRNAENLVKAGAKSVIVVGSANTAFDVMVNCYNAGLETTMVQRSETFVLPVTSCKHPAGFGMYDILPTDKADAITHASPLAVGGPILFRLHAMMSEAEPDRYKPVREAGFLVHDATKGDILYQLLDRCGGHFIDMGPGIDLLATKKVGIKSGVSPTGYTPEGLRLSDGTYLTADAIIWCTGFGSGDGRKGISDALGIGSEQIAGRMEPLWGVDAEGEVRGLYKRGSYQDNVWVLAGGTTAHRFYSKVIALQIKGLLEGLLPEPYRETPIGSCT